MTSRRSARMLAIGIALLGTGALVALVAIGTKLGQTLGAILVLFGGALIAASWLLLPAGPKADISALPASRTEDAIPCRD